MVRSLPFKDKDNVEYYFGVAGYNYITWNNESVPKCQKAISDFYKDLMKTNKGSLLDINVLRAGLNSHVALARYMDDAGVDLNQCGFVLFKVFRPSKVVGGVMYSNHAWADFYYVEPYPGEHKMAFRFQRGVKEFKESDKINIINLELQNRGDTWFFPCNAEQCDIIINQLAKELNKAQ